MRVDEAVRHMRKVTGGSTATVCKSMGQDQELLIGTLVRVIICKAGTLAQIAKTCGCTLVFEGHGEKTVIGPE